MNLLEIDDFNLITDSIDYLEEKTPIGKVPVCIAASVYRMSAGNCMPNQKPLKNQQKTESPWDMYIHKNKYMSSACSSTTTLDSSCSSLSDSTEPVMKDKKKSKNMLLREIRRLKDENTSLRNSVIMLKNDLRDITLSRQDTDASHKKFYDECMNKNDQLENDIEDRNDEIKKLKQEIEELKQRHQLHTPPPEEPCGSFEQDESEMQDYLNRRFDAICINEEEEEEEELETSATCFEDIAASYIHQAIMSKLTSARVRLELDDLIVKYEPSADTVINVLSLSFTKWISSLLLKNQSCSASKVFSSQIQNGIVDFWETILQYYTTDECNQIGLLNHIEDNTAVVQSGNTIQDHFDRLVLMLYKYHVVDDDAVVTWWQHPLENDDSKKIRKTTTRFVEWLQDEDEDEEDDDEEEEEESDEEDCIDEDDDDVFSFVESPLSEDPSSDHELKVNQTVDEEREPCFCQLDTNNNDSCSCTINSPSPVIEKKKKSVRIAL